MSDADLSTCSGLTTAQLEGSVGNARTKLPGGVDRPTHWEDFDPAEIDEKDEIPAQRPAPLKLIWRQERLVPDPRGGAEARLRSGPLFVLYRELSKDVRELAERPSNHPIAARLKQLSRCLEGGIAGINPVEVGYHGELLRHQLPSLRDELSSDTVSSIEGVIAGVGIFVSQFPEWREVSEAADAVSGVGTKELAYAIRDLASSVRKNNSLFDARVADSLDHQAQDLDATGNNRIKTGALNSAGNVFSALGSKVWSVVRRGATVASEEALKVSIRQFVESNSGLIAELARLAPATLGWMKAWWLKLLS